MSYFQHDPTKIVAVYDVPTLHKQDTITLTDKDREIIHTLLDENKVKYTNKPIKLTIYHKPGSINVGITNYFSSDVLKDI